MAGESGRRDNNAGGADDVTGRAGGDGAAGRAEWLPWQGIPEGHSRGSRACSVRGAAQERLHYKG